MLHLYELKSSLWLNPVFLLSSQVYKATGEEFLKIAGGQISGFFFSPLFTPCLYEDFW